MQAVCAFQKYWQMQHVTYIISKLTFAYSFAYSITDTKPPVCLSVDWAHKIHTAYISIN